MNQKYDFNFCVFFIFISLFLLFFRSVPHMLEGTLSVLIAHQRKPTSAYFKVLEKNALPEVLIKSSSLLFWIKASLRACESCAVDDVNERERESSTCACVCRSLNHHCSSFFQRRARKNRSRDESRGFGEHVKLASRMRFALDSTRGEETEKEF
jgi:hypothetical protein